MSEMVEVKVAELEGASLDWAVAYHVLKDESDLWECDEDSGCVFVGLEYSLNWEDGGPLIERYDVMFCGASFYHDGMYMRNIVASVGKSKTKSGKPVRKMAYQLKGEGHLIAAMRAIVASEMGETVQVPKELA